MTFCIEVFFIVLAILSHPYLLEIVGEREQSSKCGTYHIVNHGETFLFSDDTSYRPIKQSSSSMIQVEGTHSIRFTEAKPKKLTPYRYTGPNDIFEGPNEISEPSPIYGYIKHKKMNQKYPQRFNHDEFSSRGISKHDYFDTADDEEMFRMSGSNRRSSMRSDIPPLYSGYFQKPNEKNENQVDRKAKNSKYAEKANNPDIIKIMRTRFSTRKRRSVPARERLLAKRGLLNHNTTSTNSNACVWEYLVGNNCQKLVTHFSFGDTSKMKCENQFLKFIEDSSSKRYCGGNRLQKTGIHGKKLSIEYFKKLGTTGESFRGLVVCK